MEHWQSWPSQTSVGGQTFAGSRLRYISNENACYGLARPRLTFDFARLGEERTIRSQQPLLRTFPASIDNADKAKVVHPYCLLVTANRFLREHHPQVNLPKELLLSHLLEDREEEAVSAATSAPKLANCAIGEHIDLIISVGGPLSNELYCSAIQYQLGMEPGSTPIPRFHATSKPSLTFPTPILQLASGPSSTPHYPTLFLARTLQSTHLLSSTMLEKSVALDSLPLPYHPNARLAPSEIATFATRRTTHVDACIAQNFNRDAYGVLVDSKGGVWKTNHTDSEVTCSQIGTVNDSEEGQVVDWARCGTSTTDCCITVGLRKSVKVIDPRAGPNPTSNLLAPGSRFRKLYALENNHLLTDIQRHSSRFNPHLRFINNTQSLICLDVRKPGTPLLAIPHFRTHDLTLSMSFPSELEESLAALDTDGDLTSKMSPIILWSRNNDVASLYSFRAYSDKPPNFIGYPHSVPVLPTQRFNPRSGLVFTARYDKTSTSNHLSVVEATEDGALWHQVVSLEDVSESVGPLAPACSPSIRCIWDQELYKRDAESTNTPRLAANTPIKVKLPTLSEVCQDFLKIFPIRMDTQTQNFPPERKPMPTNYFTRPLEFAAHLADEPGDPLHPLPEKQPETESDQRDTPTQNGGKNCDITTMALSVLYSKADKYLNMGFASTLAENNHAMIDYLISLSARSSLHSSFTRSQSRLDSRKEPMEPVADRIDLVDRLMCEWPIGVPTSQYEWKHISIDEAGDDNESMAFSSSSRRQSPTSQMPLNHSSFTSAYDFSDAVSRIEVRSSQKQLTTPGRTPQQTFASPFALYSPLAAPSPLGESCPQFAQSQSFLASFRSGSPETQGEASRQAFSQILPGPHGDRTLVGAPAKKKKRLGGF